LKRQQRYRAARNLTRHGRTPCAQASLSVIPSLGNLRNPQPSVPNRTRVKSFPEEIYDS